MKTEKTVILDMTKFGIKTLVGAKQKKIDFYLTSYRTQPDSRFGGGVGKKQLMTYTYNCIQAEDKFFDRYPEAAESDPQRWLDFLEDCIIYATLFSYLNDEPLSLVEEPLNSLQSDQAEKQLTTTLH